MTTDNRGMIAGREFPSVGSFVARAEYMYAEGVDTVRVAGRITTELRGSRHVGFVFCFFHLQLLFKENRYSHGINLELDINYLHTPTQSTSYPFITGYNRFLFCFSSFTTPQPPPVTG